MKNTIYTALLGIISLGLSAQYKPFETGEYEQKKWVDSIYNTMDLNAKLGQLFVVQAYSNKGDQHVAQIESFVKKEKIGGIIFTKGTPVAQAKLTNQYQKSADIPLMISMDAEWDLDMRLKGGYKYPWAMTTGAITDNELIFEMGASIAEHCKRLGVQTNFGPVIDVNTNPKNPIIGNRSFGSSVENVAQKGVAYTRGMASERVLASAKHFPGHGDTSTDSHKTLPTVAHDISRLNEIELAPYQALIDANVGSIMIAHLNVPALEPNAKIPSSLSKRIITDLLKNKLNYEGLIFTDALEMKGVADLYPSGEVEVKAFLAGNDILLMSKNIPLAKRKLIEAYNAGKITPERLEESVKKILYAKYWTGLNRYTPIDSNNLVQDLNDKRADALHLNLMESAVTLVKNEQDLLPIKNLSNKKVAYISLGENSGTKFYETLKKYASITKVSAKYINSVKNYDYVIVGVHKSNTNPWKSYNISEYSKTIINQIKQLNKRVVLSVFTSPYSLKNLDISNISSMVMAYQNSTFGQIAAAEAIFGAIDFKGILPVDINENIPVGTGIVKKNLNRLKYGIPEMEYMDSQRLQQIDSLANYALKIGATPGMQVLVARNGRVVYEKSFGYQSNKKKYKVKLSDIYDVASITKVVSSLPMVMKLDSENKLNIDLPIGNYIKSVQNTNKANLKLRDILTHQARLTPWIPFYRETRIDSTLKPSPSLYKTFPTEDFTTKVANELYIKDSYRDSILTKIYASKLRPYKKYKYSDLGYYLIQKHLESFYSKPLNQLANSYFYQPLGAYSTTYNPLEKFSKRDIVPTEQDNYYRMQLVHGYVHDQGAAMMGGVAGHAGVFSNVNDLAKIFQMYMNKGFYGGKEFFKPEIIDEYIQYQYKENKNRRGVGFDKVGLEKGNGSASHKASELSFGHTGFTGTMAWADPKEKLIFVFLSNRVNPSAENRELIKKNIRTLMHDRIYESLTATLSNE